MTGDLTADYARAAGQAIVETVMIVAGAGAVIYALLLGFVHLDRPIRLPTIRLERRRRS